MKHEMFVIKDIEKAQNFSTTTVALITSSSDDRINVMSAEWTIRSSIEPFMITIFIGYERGSYEMIKKSGEFGLSYCSERQGELAHIAGNYSIRDTDKFSTGKFRAFPSSMIKPPLIENAICAFECRVESEFRVGDHAAFNGIVLEGYYSDGEKPLVFHGGKFHQIGDIIKH